MSTLLRDSPVEVCFLLRMVLLSLSACWICGGLHTVMHFGFLVWFPLPASNILTAMAAQLPERNLPSATERTFHLLENPISGPQRLDIGWSERSLLSCASTCMLRYQTECWSVMYNSRTGLCTPGKWLNATESPPSEEEGELYLGYTCDLKPEFRVYAYSDIPVCLAYFSGSVYWKKYSDAAEYCRSLKSHLFISKKATKFTVLRQVVTSSAWIGLDDRQQEGNFTWITDCQALRPNVRDEIFKAGEPKNEETSDCVYVSDSDDWLASEVPCDLMVGFICEKGM